MRALRLRSVRVASGLPVAAGTRVATGARVSSGTRAASRMREASGTGLAALVRVVVTLVLLMAAGAAVADEGARARAEAHYRAGLSLFDAGNREQALVEFRLANTAQPSPEAVFMMAQCEYHLGQLKDAREHYQAYLAREPKGALAATARLRLEAIDARPSVMAITTVPDNVDVLVEGGQTRIVGIAPSEIKLPRGRYRVTITKPNFAPQTREVELGIAETRPLFFKLDPIPARLEIRTLPRNAALYVRGARSLNPYAQNVEPGSYEVYAEATDYRPASEVFVLAPGEQRTITFALPYVQRSGRPELIAFWTAAGGVAASTAYLALLDGDERNKVKSLSFVGAAGAVGAISAGLLATAQVPDYIPDNRALFRIGGAWAGAAEGAALALVLDSNRSVGWAWIGGASGLALGATAGVLLDNVAPNYGRTATIQSAIGVGLLAGVTSVSALDLNADYLPMAALVGLNAGLVGGLALGYLPNRGEYGPSWRRVALIDLAGVAGALTGILGAAVKTCLDQTPGNAECGPPSAPFASQLALAGGGLGLAAGWLLTRNFDQRAVDRGGSVPVIPMPAALPSISLGGGMTVVPGLAASGRF